jgi:hypothetical protein
MLDIQAPLDDEAERGHDKESTYLLEEVVHFPSTNEDVYTRRSWPFCGSKIIIIITNTSSGHPTASLEAPVIR